MTLDSSPSTRAPSVPLDPWRAASSRASHPSAGVDGEPLVLAIARGLAAVTAPWEWSTGDAPTERSYELLLSTDQYDAWLIHWPPGTGIDAHDHGGSVGAFGIVAGELAEDVSADGATTTRVLGEGDATCFGADHVHAVFNRGALGATSVHVYSPPLRSMSFYRPTADGMAVTRTDDVEAARR